MKALRITSVMTALLLSAHGCGSPTQPDPPDADPPDPVPADPLHAALVERLEALSDPSVDPNRRAAEERIFEALIALFEAAE